MDNKLNTTQNIKINECFVTVCARACELNKQAVQCNELVHQAICTNCRRIYGLCLPDAVWDSFSIRLFIMICSENCYCRLHAMS